MIKKLFETMYMGDLEGTIKNEIYIDEFEPKSDPDATVIAFVAIDENPAIDLEKFIDFGPNDDILDTDVSPAPDENGNYFVFVEIMAENKKKLAYEIIQLLHVVRYLTTIKEWKYNYKNKSSKIELKDSQLNNKEK